MNTKLLMVSSSFFFGIIGLLLTFLPKEIMIFFDMEVNGITFLIIQILGSFYMAFGFLNWMSKHQLIGGIYNRPFVLANVYSYAVSGLALLKIVFKTQNHFYLLFILTIGYVLFALSFIYVFMTNPIKEK